MTALDKPLLFRPYRVPRQHAAALIDPPLADAPRLLAANQEGAERWDLEFAGQSLGHLRREARRQMLADAVQHTRAYRDVELPLPRADQPILAAGHQPELFHPGVWFKNFALADLARHSGAVPVNLVVDNDLCRTRSVRVPTRRAGKIRGEVVPIDAAAVAVPFEQGRIAEGRVFEQFDQRLSDAVAPLVPDPCVRQLWPHAREAARRCQSFGCALAAARHALEGELGVQTWEVPLSTLCRRRPFAAFVLGLLAELPRFHDAYNTAVHEYRAAHGIRSRAHPVPDLGERDGWLEAPLWIYSDADPQRRGAWVRVHQGRLQISDRQGREVTLQSDPDTPAAADELFERASPQFKLRPRALTTTMYARLVLSDLFLHGIGGGKYDQLGDLIMERFFGIQPPRFMVLSATVLLPPCDGPPNGASVRRLRRGLRDVDFHPERWLGEGSDAEVAALLAEKRRLLAAIPPRGEKRAWHEAITAVNGRLAARLESTRTATLERLTEALAADREAAFLASREHPFCVYPLERMTEAFDRLLARREW